MLFFPLMTDGRAAGLVEITFQAFFGNIRVKYYCIYAAQFCTVQFFQQYHSSLLCSGANSITTVTTPPHQQSPAFVLLQMAPLFWGAIKVLKVMGGIVLLVVLRGITFILDLLCLLTLSRIRAAGEVLACSCSCTPRLTPVTQSFSCFFGGENFTYVANFFF